MATAKRGRPKKKDVIRKTCFACKKAKELMHFYASKSVMFEDGRTNLCKECVKLEVNVDDLDSVKKMLRQLDKPFIWSVWKAAFESEKDTFGNYLRQISALPQYKDLTYEDSKDKPEEEMYDFAAKKDINKAINEYDINAETKRKWGTGYSNREYYELEKLFQEMITANDISTPQHRKQLDFFCKLSVFMDRALQERDIASFEKLSRQYDSLLRSSGFRPIDRASSSESAGVRNFSTIFAEVERDGFIKPAPLREHQDIVDRSIMYILNYQRKLMNMDSMITPPDDTPNSDEYWDFIEDDNYDEDENDVPR